ncbi:MAG: transcription elongation factor GreA [Candidatus Gribaldobacteria bacterium]|nr:transcription elongation factor GreA [Candidatus Gribaldobacteria bacterium]
MPEYLTAEGLEKLKKELDYLKNVKQREIAAQLNTAASFGDLSENAAYHQGKEALSFMRGRIDELEKIIKSAKVISSQRSSSKVEIGSTIVIEVGKDKETISLVAPSESDFLAGKISYQSPIGQALLGRLKGEEVEIECPNKKIKYKILEIK